MLYTENRILFESHPVRLMCCVLRAPLPAGLHQ